MRQCVHPGGPTRRPNAARLGLGRWLMGFGEAIRVLFPEEVAARRPRPSAATVEPALEDPCGT